MTDLLKHRGEVAYVHRLAEDQFTVLTYMGLGFFLVAATALVMLAYYLEKRLK